MKHFKLNEEGVAHWLIGALVVALIAAVGTRVLIATHAQTPTANVSSSNSQFLKSLKVGPLVTIPTPPGQISRSPEATAATSNTGSILYSPNWSGYLTDSGPYTQVSGDIKVPKMTCTADEAAQESTGADLTLFWIGFDGYKPDPSTVEQDGIWATCAAAKGGGYVGVYGAWWEMYPSNDVQSMQLTMSPGNTIAMDVTYSNTGNYAFTITNKTTGDSLTASATCASNVICSHSSAEWIAERASYSGVFNLLIKWGNLKFSNAYATTTTGQNLAVGSYPNNPIDMVDSSTMLAKVQPYLDKNNDSFPDTWLAPQPSPPVSIPPSLIEISDTSSSVSLSWGTSYGGVGGVAYYNLVRTDQNGNIQTIKVKTKVTQGVIAYKDSSVLPNSQYTYYVEGVDGAGNISLPSNSVTAYTPSK